MKKQWLCSAAAISALMIAQPALSQDTANTNDDPITVAEVVVFSKIVYRNRTDDTVPILSYDLEYFQRFEPVSAGDAMRRVPSVTFLSDVLESDGARLRGLDPGYTQILINGERVPGAGLDRSFFVDRIPAELIERVEVVRSASANRSGDAMAGALNIVLRDALSLDGGYVRAGVMNFREDVWRETFGVVWGGRFGPGRLLIGANMQDRRSPKDKFSQRFDAPPALGGSLDNIEAQTDIRDGTDYSFNASYEVDAWGGELELTGLFVRTDRIQDEDSTEYDGGVVSDVNILTLNDNDLDITTDNWAVRARYEREMWGGNNVFKLGYATLVDDQFEFEDEYEYLRDAIPFPEDDRFTRDETTTDLEDTELAAEYSHKRDIAVGSVEFGVSLNRKERETRILELRARTNIPNLPAPRPTLPGPFSVRSDIRADLQETRIDPFVMFSGGDEVYTWEAGLRYESTDVEIVDTSLDVAPSNVFTTNDYGFLLPSAHLRIRTGENGRVNLSFARTVRRPNFDQLSPALLVEELGDDDFIGNPRLAPETAYGADIGYEHRLGRQGIVGVNLFYRDVKDLIELVNTGDEGDGGPGTFIYSIDNVGDGKVWGVEFDLSTPLSALGLENTGVFLNYSWLDSEVTDFMGDRRFNNQSEFVFSGGFIQDLPSWGASFGASYRKQGDAFGRVALEEIVTSYGADLEMFIEKRIGDNFVIRLTGSNLLDSSKDEVFDKFGTIGDQLSRSYDEYELETETAGPVFQIVARRTF